MRALMIAVLMLAGVASASRGQEVGGRFDRPAWTDVPIRRATSPIVLDANLDEAAWEEAAPIALPWQIEPLLNVDADQATDCRITYDQENLYYGCRLHDADPTSIRAFLVDRDRTDGHDEIGLVIDPFRDSRRAFGFVVNPLGVQTDWVLDREETNTAWDAIWDSRGRITRDGWVVEVAIPFKSLRFPSGREPQDWGFFITRVRPRTELVTYRSVPRDPSNSSCSPCQMAVVSGIAVEGSGPAVELTPVMTAQRTDTRPSPTARGLDSGDVDDQYGLDARWSVSSDLTMNLTVNPDFSQVETDAVQLQSNLQFAPFFPERRPFFLEGAEFFATPLRAVFTRTIAEPSAGAKVTGKARGWAYGVLAARDQRTNLLFPGPERSRSTFLDADNTASVARARRDVGAASTVGALVTTRVADGGYENVLVGADARIRVHPTTAVTAQVLRSNTTYPSTTAEAFDQPAGAFDGWAGRVEAHFSKREGSLTTFLQRVGRGFRADGGFITQADQQQFDIRGGFHFWMDDHPYLTRINTSGGGGRAQDASGRLLYQFVFASVNTYGPLQSRLNLNPDLFERVYEGRHFIIERLNVFGNIRPTSRVASDIFWQFGRDLDFTNARESELLRMRQNVDLRIGSSTELNLNYDIKRLGYLGERVYREQVGQARLLYYFSSRLFVRGIVQFQDVVRNPALYVVVVEPRDRSMATQFLFSYKLNPQSVVFLGYSDASFGVRENQDPTESLDLQRTSRSFFLKLSYAWRP